MTTMKAWPVRMLCQGTGAVHVQLCHDYGTKVFLIQWKHFTAVQGNLSNEEEQNGNLFLLGVSIAESRVKAPKSTLSYMMLSTIILSKLILSYADLFNLLSRAASIVNNQSIGVQCLRFD